MQFGGFFWQTFSRFQASSHAFDQLLANESTTIYDILDDDNVIQELKNQNTKLLEFLTQERVQVLIELITVFPSENADHKRGHKFPFMASELFSSESGPLLEQFFEHNELLFKLFDYLNVESVPILDGYFSKLIHSLLNKNPTALLDFISTNGLASQLVAKARCRSLSDIVSKILMLDQQGPEPFFIDLRKQLLVEVMRFFDSSDEKSHFFAGCILSDLISKIPEVNSWKELIACILDTGHINLIIGAASSCTPSKVAAGLLIFKTFLTSSLKTELIKSPKAQNEDDSTVIEDEERSEFIKIVLQLIPEITKTLKRESEQFFGTQRRYIKILGEDRLKIMDFILCCIKTEIKEIFAALTKSDTFKVLTDLFFEFEQNSMMHNLYEQILAAAMLMAANEDDGAKKLVLETGILEKLGEGLENKGYSGHLVKIGSVFLRLADRNDSFAEFLKENGNWKAFYGGFYVKRNELEKKTLGEIKANVHEDVSSEENNYNKEDVGEKMKESLSSYLKNVNSSENNEEIEEEIIKEDSKMDLSELGTEKEPNREDESPEKGAKQEENKKIEGKLEENALGIKESPEAKVGDITASTLENPEENAEMPAQNIENPSEKSFTPPKSENSPKTEDQPENAIATPELHVHPKPASVIFTQAKSFIEEHSKHEDSKTKGRYHEDAEEAKTSQEELPSEFIESSYWRFGH